MNIAQLVLYVECRGGPARSPPPKGGSDLTPPGGAIVGAGSVPAGQTTAIIPSSEGCWAEPTIQGRNRRSLFPVDGTGGCLMTPPSNKGRAAARRASGAPGQKPGLSSPDAEQGGTPHAMDYQIADRPPLRGDQNCCDPHA